MSVQPPDIHCLFPQIISHSNALDWGNGILGRDFPTTSLCFLEKLEHCKANKVPKHEFLKIFFTLHLDGKAYKMAMIADRRPAENIETEVQEGSMPRPSPIVSPHPLSLSPSPSAERLQAALGKGGKSIVADDRIIIPKFGLGEDLNGLAMKEFGSYITLNTLTVRNKGNDPHTPMTAPEFAGLVEIVHRIAPIYDLKRHNCYWFALLIFLVVKKTTGGAELGGDGIEQRGKLWYYKLGISAKVDEEAGVQNDEYERALALLQVSSCHWHDLILSTPN
jgi:hypothetical protein